MTTHDPELDAFYAKHAAGGPSHIVLAEVCDPKHGTWCTGVFSTIATALAWTATQPGNAVYSTRVIDVPEYGNVPEEQRQ